MLQIFLRQADQISYPRAARLTKKTASMIKKGTFVI
jgi:hypothetical protein